MIERNYSSTENFWNISRDDGNILKGIAVIMMFIHHILFSPTWYIIPVPLSEGTIYVGRCFKLCVAVFAFLSGWFYAKGKPKSLGYTLIKCLKLHFSFLLAFICLATAAVIFCHWRPSFSDILNELIPIGNQHLMFFCWYVAFYPLIMVILAFCDILHRKLSLRRLACAGILIISFIITWLCDPNNDFSIYIPTALVGYYLSKSRVFSDFCHFCQRGHLYRIFLYAATALILLRLWVRYAPGIIYHATHFPTIVHYLSFTWGTAISKSVYDAVYVIALMLLINRVTCCKLRHALSFLGTISMNMWFLHCIFFSPITRDIFQPFILLIPHPLFSFAALVILCIPPSILLNKVQQYFLKKLFTR